MSQARQRRPVLSSSDRDALKSRLNDSYAGDLLSIARHFGGQPAAHQACIQDIDHTGFTLAWEWREDGQLQSADMQHVMREFAGPGSVIQEVSELAVEACRELGEEPPRLARDKQAIDSRRLVDFAFVMPRLPVALLVLAGLVGLGYLALVDDVHPMVRFTRDFVSQTACYYIFVGCLVVHFFEACVVCAVCQLIKTFQPQQMSTGTQAKWTAGGLLFGVFCLHVFAAKIMRQFALADAMPANRGPRPR
ncbi:hypothetical protein LPJ70_003489 [Coemansia sp. RSA 2708]|nr:hypothetical protein LPJ70_003489 [Coemansia sp. RSA 2708]